MQNASDMEKRDKKENVRRRTLTVTALILVAVSILLIILSTIIRDRGNRNFDTSMAELPSEENRLVLYTSHKKEVYWPIVLEFESRTGIYVTIMDGGTNELIDWLRSEAESPKADVMFGGGAESLSAGGDVFEKYTPESVAVIDERFSSDNGYWTPFSALPIVLIYNTKLVEANEIESFEDLFKEEFRGRIAFADPANSGSSFTALMTIVQDRMEKDPSLSEQEVLAAFAEQLAGNQLSSSGDVLTAVADGTYLVGVSIEDTAMTRIAEGASIAISYPQDGTSAVPDGSALVKGAPHEENAKAFIEFTLSADVQKMLVERFNRRPVRTDIEAAIQSSSTENTIPLLEELDIIDYDIDGISLRKNAILETWRSCLEERRGSNE